MSSNGLLTDLAPHGHALVLLEDEQVVLIREVRSGSVTYRAPGISTVGRETLGNAAVRAAKEQLGVDVVVTDLVFADTESGVEHYFFLAVALELGSHLWDEPEPVGDGTSVRALRRSTLLAYPVHPRGIAQRLRKNSTLWARATALPKPS